MVLNTEKGRNIFMKRKILSLLLTMLLFAGTMTGCGNSDVEEAETSTVEEEETGEDEVAALTEEEAWEMAQAGTLESDPLTGYEYSEVMGQWYFSNYPAYKDFNEDGKIKIAHVCKMAGPWFTPRTEAMKEVADQYGYEYTFIDANSDEQAWLDGVQNVINQDYDIVLLTPVNTSLLPEAVNMLQEAGIAYMTADDPGADGVGFYVPHYGIDDYGLYNEGAATIAAQLRSEGFMDQVAEDYSDFLFVLQDSPDVEAIHKRCEGMHHAIIAEFPDIPEDCILWLDCGTNTSDDILTKFSSTIESYKDTVKYWIVASGGGLSFVANGTLFREAGVDIGNCVRMIDGISMEDQVLAMMKDEDMMRACSGMGIVSPELGRGQMEMIHEYLEKDEPFPAFYGAGPLMLNKDTIQDYYDTYIAAE